MSYELEALARWVAAPIEGRRPPDLAFTAGPAREVADHVRALELQKGELERLIVMLDDTLSGVRLVSSDQNPMGWRDLLGAAASKVRRSEKRKCEHAESEKIGFTVWKCLECGDTFKKQDGP